MPLVGRRNGRNFGYGGQLSCARPQALKDMFGGRHYACERYAQITHHPAPINGGHYYQLDRRLDQEARVQISYELGHNRIVVVAAYIGGRA